MVQAEDVISILDALSEHGIQVWLTGGWGVDALLQGQTRPHKDLDFLMLVDDVARLRAVLGAAGFRLKELWEENNWVRDSHGTDVPTAFVLQDPLGRELDAHAMRLDDRRNGCPAWTEGELVFSNKDLGAEGVIAGIPVRCITAEMQLRTHTGYELPDEQLSDVRLLRERFCVKLPE